MFRESSGSILSSMCLEITSRFVSKSPGLMVTMKSVRKVMNASSPPIGVIFLAD